MSDDQVQYIKLPDGSYGKFAAGANDATIRAAVEKDFPDAFKAAPDSRNSIQKSFDENTTTSPKESLLQTGLKSVVGAIGAPFVHPVDTIAGMAKAVAHPIDTAHQEVDQLYADKAAGGVGYAATKLAGQAFGTVALGEAGGAVRAALPKASTVVGRAALLGKTPEAAYESALKPSTTLSQAERAGVIKTGLEQGIPISKGGLEKLGGQIEAVNDAIKGEIAKDPNRPIDPNKVATRADEARAKFAQQVNAGGDLQAIEDSKRQFLNEQGAKIGGQAPPMNAADAQVMKQGTYRVLKGKFGEQGSASVEAQKALARGLKEEIAEQFPEIKGLNADLSKMLDLEPILERAVSRISNHQAIGIGTPVAGVAAEALTKSSGVGIVASVIKGVIDNPNVKSRIAIAVSKSSKIPISQAMAKVQAYSAALAASAASSQGGSPDDTPSQSSTPQP